MRLHTPGLAVPTPCAPTGKRCVQQRETRKCRSGLGAGDCTVELGDAKIELLEIQAALGEVAVQRLHKVLLLPLADRSVVGVSHRDRRPRRCRKQQSR